MKSIGDLIFGLYHAFRDPRVRGMSIFTISMILVAAFFYRVIEGWNMLDSIYFSAMTIATVGYGDLVPRTDAGKIFTIFYVLIGLGVFVATATAIAQAILAERKTAEERRRTEAAEKKARHK